MTASRRNVLFLVALGFVLLGTIWTPISGDGRWTPQPRFDLDYEIAGFDPALLTDGDLVRRVDAPRQKGLHRVAWRAIDDDTLSGLDREIGPGLEPV